MLSYLPLSNLYPLDARVRCGFKTYEGEGVLAITRILKTLTWSPIVWKDGVRNEKNFLYAHYAALDFESPDVSIKQIVRSYCDTWHVVGTTRNHQKAKGDQPAMDRFRLLLKLERPITDLQEYKHNMRLLAHHNGADKACVDGARLFFACKEIVSVETSSDLFCEPVREAPKLEEIKVRQEAYIKSAQFHNGYGRMSSYATRWLSNEIPLHNRNNTCLRLACELARAGVEYEDAVKKILASPTYIDRELSFKLNQEIRNAVKNGYKLAGEQPVYT